MNDVLSLMGGGGNGGYVSPVMGGGGQYSGIIQQMLQGLLKRKSGITIGTNKAEIDRNSDQLGFIDPQGVYHAGSVPSF